MLSKINFRIFFPDKFNNLKIIDRPDLQDINNGVEVTNATPEQYMKIEAMAGKYWNGKIKNKEAVKKVIGERNSKSIDKGIVTYPPLEENFDDILKAMNSKINKLNNQTYRIFDINSLFVYSCIYADETMLRSA